MSLDDVGNSSKAGSNEARNGKVGTAGRRNSGNTSGDGTVLGRNWSTRRGSSRKNRSDGRRKNWSSRRNRADSCCDSSMNLGSSARTVSDGQSSSLSDGVSLVVFNNDGGLRAVSGVRSDDFRGCDLTRNGDGGEVGETSSGNTSKSSNGGNSEFHYEELVFLVYLIN